MYILLYFMFIAGRTQVFAYNVCKKHASFRSLKTALFSLGLSHWTRFWLVCTARCAI